MPRLTTVASTFLGAAALALFLLGPASAASTRYGGTLVVGVTEGETGSLDPTMIGLFSGVEIDRTFCERLYDTDDKGRVFPELASALPSISKDKRTYTIALRKGVEFNDGTPFDAQAVATTIERDQTLPGSLRASDFNAVDSVAAAGPYTVVIHLSTPFTPLTVELASADGMIMSPTALAAEGANFGAHPVCVGPFMFDNRVVGDHVTVIKSPFYYDKLAVHLDKIVFKFMNDSAAAAAALEAGDLQAVDGLPTTGLAGIERNRGLRILKEDSLGFNGIGFNLQGNTPFDTTAKLRQAFEEAIDRNALAKVVFAGGVLPGCTPLSPVSPWFDPSIRCTPYDPADARRLIAATGVADPTVHLLTSSLPDSERLAEFIQAEEDAVGIRVVIDIGDRASASNWEAYMASWSGNPDPDENLYQFLATGGVRNNTGYTNPRVDLILANSRKAQSRSARQKLYTTAQRIVLADRPIIYLYHLIKFSGISANVTGVHLDPDTQLRVAYAQLT